MLICVKLDSMAPCSLMSFTPALTTHWPWNSLNSCACACALDRAHGLSVERVPGWGERHDETGGHRGQLYADQHPTLTIAGWPLIYRYYDVGVAMLNKSLPLSDSISTLCLPTQNLLNILFTCSPNNFEMLNRPDKARRR